MSLDGKLLAEARAELYRIKSENIALYDRRRAEIFSKIPAIAEIERQLRALVSELVAVSLKNRENPEETLRSVEDRSMSLLAEKERLLVAGGYSASYLDEIAACHKCGDNGYDKNGKICSCLMEIYEKKRAKQLSVLTKLGDEGFADFDLSYYDNKTPDAALGITPRECMELVLSICREYAVTFGRDSANLLFRGGTGLGKTLLSACIAKTVSGAGFSAAYETAAAAFEAFENRKFSRNPDTLALSEERVRRILECDLLILDDLGTEMTTAFTQSALYTIINSRLTAEKKTIVSTNLSESEMAARYTPQIFSRLSGEFDTLLFVGRDIRAIKKERRYN